LTKNKRKIELSESALYVFGAVRKRRQHSEGRRICPLQTFCGLVGFSRSVHPTFFVANDFSKIMVCPHGQGQIGVEAVCGH